MTMANVHLAPNLAPSAFARGVARARDFAALTKPRVTMLVVWTAAAGALTAPGPRSPLNLATTVAGTALIVGAANALNMWVERDVDGRMARTRRRPLPAGRIVPGAAVAFGCALAALALPLLKHSNALTALLGLVALGIYVGAYTPLKRVTDLALWVGALPGAIPPLMGRTSVTGKIDAGGLLLFGLLFFWQLLHFAAISLVREREYRDAGFVVLSVARGAWPRRRAARDCRDRGGVGPGVAVPLRDRGRGPDLRLRGRRQRRGDAVGRPRYARRRRRAVGPSCVLLVEPVPRVPALGAVRRQGGALTSVRGSSTPGLHTRGTLSQRGDSPCKPIRRLRTMPRNGTTNR